VAKYKPSTVNNPKRGTPQCVPVLQHISRHNNAYKSSAPAHVERTKNTKE